MGRRREKPNKKIGRRIRALCAVWLWILMIFTIILAVPVMAGYRPMMVMMEGMSPNYPAGSFSYYKKVDYLQLKVGDVVIYRNETGVSEIRRIVGLDPQNSRLSVQYDQESEDAVKEITYSKVEGCALSFAIPYAGILLEIMGRWYVIAGIFLFLLINGWQKNRSPDDDKKVRRARRAKKLNAKKKDVTAAEYFKGF